MRRFCALLLVATAIMTSGCEIGRQWFQIDSNSGTPRFGIDLLPRRKTTYRSETNGEPTTVPVNQRQAVELRLPHISNLVSNEQEENLQLPRVRAH